MTKPTYQQNRADQADAVGQQRVSDLEDRVSLARSALVSLSTELSAAVHNAQIWGGYRDIERLGAAHEKLQRKADHLLAQAKDQARRADAAEAKLKALHRVLEVHPDYLDILTLANPDSTHLQRLDSLVRRLPAGERWIGFHLQRDALAADA